MTKFTLFLNSISLLRSDLIPFSFNPEFVFNKILFIFCTFIIFLTFYVIGRIILEKIFTWKNDKQLYNFLSFGIGYIIYGYSIFFLGITPFFSRNNVMILFFTYSILSFTYVLKKGIKFTKIKKEQYKSVLLVLSVVIIISTFIRTLMPEIGADALDYHTNFPRIYLENKTTMLKPLGNESTVTIPQLPEMIYIISETLSHGDASRMIHFGFYFLLFLLIINIPSQKVKQKTANLLTGLLFTTAPLVMHIAPSAYSDFFALYCLVLSLLILVQKNSNIRAIILSGILLGGAIASKLWIIGLLPFISIYLLKISYQFKKPKNIAVSVIFVISTLFFPMFWFIRSLILSGSPFYQNQNFGLNDLNLTSKSIILNTFEDYSILARINFISDYGFVFVIGLILFLLKVKSGLNLINKKLLFVIGLVLFSHFILPKEFILGRYDLPVILCIFILSGIGFSLFWKNIYEKVIILILFIPLILYYLLNSIIFIPYLTGFASTEKYLEREMYENPAEYYDFGGKFSKNVSKDEIIVTYGLREYYYADFKYKNIYYFYDQNNRMLDLPVNIHKLLIRGGDFNWFCKEGRISNCESYKIKEIVFDKKAKEYLYNIELWKRN